MLLDKNVLITGGYGFIGSNLVKYLVDKKLAKSITVLDRIHSERPEKMERLKSIEDKFTIIKDDIRKIDHNDSHFKDIDVIFHQAAFVSVPESIKNPTENFETNVLGTVKLLETCRKNDIGCFVSASSAAIYGDQEVVPIKEIAELKPTSPYGLSKMMSEDYCRIFSELYGIKTISLRYFNVYGPGQNFRGKTTGIISILKQKIQDNESFKIYGNGEQTRDFINVSDIVEANLLAASSNLGKGEALNIATGKSVSMNQLLELANNITGKEIEVSHSAQREGDILNSVADVSLAKEKLGFEAKVSIEEGLKSL